MEKQTRERKEESPAASWYARVSEEARDASTELARLEAATDGREATREEYRRIKDAAKLASFYGSLRETARFAVEAEENGNAALLEKMRSAFTEPMK